MTNSPIAITLLVFAAPVAVADPGEPISSNEPQRPSKEPLPPAPAPPAPPSTEPSAADVATAPVPGAEAGRTDPVDDGDSVPRVVARGLLFFPRLVIDGALMPIRGTVWAFEKYKLT